MKTVFTAVCLVVGVLLAPVAGYAADTKADSKAPASTTEKAKAMVEDSWITTKIKADYAADKQVSAMNIKVDTMKGVVTLSGNAKSQAEADKAVSIAKGTKGVMSVKNDIQMASAGTK